MESYPSGTDSQNKFFLRAVVLYHSNRAVPKGASQSFPSVLQVLVLPEHWSFVAFVIWLTGTVVNAIFYT